MANLRKWSTTASGNASIAGGPATINFSEGQNPGTVNNSAREMMAQIRNLYTPDEWGWVEHSATASVASQTTFKISGDQTTYWTAGRRWRLKSASTTRYGAVVSSSYTAETTVTVTVDSGSLSASHTLAALAAITSNHIPDGGYVTSNSASAMIASQITTALTPYAASNSVSVMIAGQISALPNFVTSNSASAMIATQVAAGAGGVTFLGTITTTSGTSANLGSLTLTNYKFLRLTWNTVGGGSNASFLIGNTTSDDVQCTPSSTSSETLSGIMEIDLFNGIGVFNYIQNSAPDVHGNFGFDSALSTASTTVTVAPSTGSFDNGSIRVYGIK